MISDKELDIYNELYFLIKDFDCKMQAYCHTDAYIAGHKLDDKLRELLSLPSNSDYGHSGTIYRYFYEIMKSKEI